MRPTSFFDPGNDGFDGTTQFTGIKVYPASGTITGRWSLYGYAK